MVAIQKLFAGALLFTASAIALPSEKSLAARQGVPPLPVPIPPTPVPLPTIGGLSLVCLLTDGVVKAVTDILKCLVSPDPTTVAACVSGAIAGLGPNALKCVQDLFKGVPVPGLPALPGVPGVPALPGVPVLPVPK